MQKICSVEGCERVFKAKGYCNLHHLRLLRKGDAGSASLLANPRPDLCCVSGCGNTANGSKGYCKMHYGRFKKKGDPGIADPLRARPGEGHVDKNGYRVICKMNHPNSTSKQGYILEHRWVMSEHLGRPLLPGENVHHKNGVRTDNRIENLEIWVKSQPCGQRIEDMIEYATEVLQKYAPERLK